MRRRTLQLATLAMGGVLLSAGAYAAEKCATGPVTVGFLPKLDTDPYFQVARTGAEEAQGEIGAFIGSNTRGDAQQNLFVA